MHTKSNQLNRTPYKPHPTFNLQCAELSGRWKDRLELGGGSRKKSTAPEILYSRKQFLIVFVSCLYKEDMSIREKENVGGALP